MKKTNRIFFIACLIIGGFLILCARPQISLAGPPGPPTWDVNVVNEPTVQSQQSGEWNVNVSGEVSINNDELNPVPVTADNVDVKVVNEPIVKAEQTGSWSMTIDNDELNPVPVTTDNVFRFVGLSTYGTEPNIGLNGMHQLCQADFGDTARMCTTKELFETPDLSSIRPGSIAWIQPVIAGVTYEPPTNKYLYVDVTGKSFYGTPYAAGTCGMWYNPATADELGVCVRNFYGHVSIQMASCSRSYYVACCSTQ